MHLICAIAIVVLGVSTAVHAAVGDIIHLFGKENSSGSPPAPTVCGDGAPYSTTATCLNGPYDMWINTVRNVMYVIQNGGHRVREIPLDGTSPVFTFIGDPSANTPGSVVGPGSRSFLVGFSIHFYLIGLFKIITL